MHAPFAHLLAYQDTSSKLQPQLWLDSRAYRACHCSYRCVASTAGPQHTQLLARRAIEAPSLPSLQSSKSSSETPSQQRRDAFSFLVLGVAATPSPRNHGTMAKNGGEVWTAAGKSQDDFMLRDECILLDFADNVIGHDNKYNAHKWVVGQPRGMLHRAFSVMLFDKNG